jgi:uncharacterized protein DUF6223
MQFEIFSGHIPRSWVMKNEKRVLTGIIAACAACVISVAGYSPSSQTPNRTADLSNGAHAGVNLYRAQLGLAGEVPRGMTSGRARSLVGGVVGLLSLIIGALALARAGRSGNGRAGAIAALALGLLGIILSVIHLSTFTGGFGTGSGRAGAIVALVLSVIGISLGGLAFARFRHSRSTA